MSISKILAEQEGWRENAAMKITPAGASLKCNVCKSERPILPAQTQTYLSHGWPKCCGHTMTLRSPDTEKEK